MKVEVLRLKRGRDARARVHPWIFKGDVADVTDVEPGAVVTVVDSAGRFVGRGFYNPRPALCCRILTWRDEPIGDALLCRRIATAVAQSLTLAMAQRRRDVAVALRTAIGDVPVFSADDPAHAALEGFDAERGWLDRQGPGSVVVEEGPVKIGVTFGQGHKTGLYLDQQENRMRVAAHAA